jgi:hypothetical protein
MSSDEELILVERDAAARLRAYYRQEAGFSSLIFFSEGRLKLENALGAVRETVRISSRPNARVHFRPEQDGAPAKLMVHYPSVLTDEESLNFAQAFMRAIKLRG